MINQKKAARAAAEILAGGTPVITLGVSSHLERLMPIFKVFCKKPVTYREGWRIDKRSDPDLGYIYKAGGGFDFKHYFHYTPGIETCLRETTEDERHMLSLCHKVWKSVDTVTTQIFWEIDQQTEIKFGFLKRYKSLSETFRLRLRLLNYEPHAENFANVHFDRDALTFHLWESKPALIVNGRPYVARKNKVLLMPGIKSTVLTDPQYQNGDIKDGWYPQGFISSAKHHAPRAAGDLEGRLAVVAFAHLDLPEYPIEYSDKFFSDLQKRLQLVL